MRCRVRNGSGNPRAVSIQEVDARLADAINKMADGINDADRLSHHLLGLWQKMGMENRRA
jgi:hypothetical protein